MAKVDKLLEQAKEHLHPGEQVLAVVQGTYETTIMGSDTMRSGILLATQTRVLFYAKKLGGYELESFSYGSISSFEQSKTMMGHAVTFYASGNKVTVKWIADAAALKRLVTSVRENIHVGPTETIPGTWVPQPPAAPPVVPAAAAPTAADQAAILDTLRQLGELHQSGVLSDDEFARKKAELLARL